MDRLNKAFQEQPQGASSQKSGAHPLEKPGQKRDDKSSSANLPQNIEMIPQGRKRKAPEVYLGEASAT